MEPMSRILKLIISLLLSFTAAGVGSVFTTSAIPTWYAELSKPSFSPPSWLFGPVWTLLYFLMGVSFFLVWEKVGDLRKMGSALYVFLAQLVLNSLWSVLFFGLKSPLLALFEIILLWVAILLTILTFKEISPRACLLLLPYLAWVSFAAILNFSIVDLNLRRVNLPTQTVPSYEGESLEMTPRPNPSPQSLPSTESPSSGCGCGQ